MPRTGMASLIDSVERLLQDSDNTFWTPDQVQDGLDRARLDVHQAPLNAVPTYTSTGASYFKYFYGPALNDRLAAWETDLVIYDSAWADVTSGFTRDYLTGLFTRTSTSLEPPAYITGASYDLYAAAAWLLGEKLASVAPNYAFSAAGQSYSSNQEYDMWARLRSEYLGRQRSQVARMVRTDSNGAGMSSMVYPRYERPGY